MIEKRIAADRYHIESDWLSAYWLFSFDRYYDADNMAFGPLRVFNHDTIQPGAGFPTHPHREMEIVTYVLEGQLAHKDSTGGRGFISAGEVQTMSAGTGIAHSELNASESNPVRLLQIWLMPKEAGLTPGYDQKQFSVEARSGKLLPIASGMDHPGSLRIHQDATFYVARLDNAESVIHKLDASRRAFLYVIEGEIELNGEAYLTGDQARIIDISQLQITAVKPAEIILIDLP